MTWTEMKAAIEAAEADPTHRAEKWPRCPVCGERSMTGYWMADGELDHVFCATEGCAYYVDRHEER
jgi:hypothetical protein